MDKQGQEDIHSRQCCLYNGDEGIWEGERLGSKGKGRLQGKPNESDDGSIFKNETKRTLEKEYI